MSRWQAPLVERARRLVEDCRLDVGVACGPDHCVMLVWDARRDNPVSLGVFALDNAYLIGTRVAESALGQEDLLACPRALIELVSMPVTPDQIPEPLRPQVRTGLLPQVAEGEGDARGTRFGGRPWLPEGVPWPACMSCGNSMQLFAQIDLAAAPGTAPTPGEGLLQLFYCTNSEPLCELDLEGYMPFSDVAMARIVAGSGAGALGEPSGITPFPARQVVGWVETADVPVREERKGARAKRVTREALGGLDTPAGGDKWLGWPRWIQGVEYPKCRICRRQMAMLLQITSAGHLPYTFGDHGAGHLTICQDHPDEMSFHWACL